MTIINLTPHTVIVMNHHDDVIATYPPSGVVARITDNWEDSVSMTAWTGVPVKFLQTGDITGLPAWDKKSDTFYIVSRILADAASAERTDILFPGKEVRNAQGQIIGCLFLGAA